MTTSRAVRIKKRSALYFVLFYFGVDIIIHDKSTQIDYDEVKSFLRWRKKVV